MLKNTVYDYPASNWPSFFGLNFEWVYDAWKPATNFLIYIARVARPIYPGSDKIDERYYIAMLFFTLVMLAILFLNARRSLRAFSNMAIIPLMAGCGIQILSYTATAYGGAKEWYWSSQMVLIVIVGSLLLEILIHPLKKILGAKQALEYAALACAVYLAYEIGRAHV